MIKPRKTSVVILITLAELAWLSAFGLLFAYRGKVGELGKAQHALAGATNELAVYRTNAPNLANLLAQLNTANTNLHSMEARLAVFEKYLNGQSPEEAARRLVAGDAVIKQVDDLNAQLKTMRAALDEKNKQNEDLQTSIDRLQQQLAAAQTRATNLTGDLQVAQGKLRTLIEGEFAIRRELTGLPDGKLSRVVFLVDTSTSMRNSPAWDSAKKLVRTWLEFLPVEECAMINFNDAAVGFPKSGYLRVRQTNGAEIREARERLLSIFDNIGSGTYTDLLRGLRLAYTYPQADVMVLFTDGHPHIASQSDSALARDIFDLVAKNPKIPILTVALGSYETEGAGGPRPRTNAPVAFLKELAKKSGGNFLAR